MKFKRWGELLFIIAGIWLIWAGEVLMGLACFLMAGMTSIARENIELKEKLKHKNQKGCKEMMK